MVESVRVSGRARRGTQLAGDPRGAVRSTLRPGGRDDATGRRDGARPGGAARAGALAWWAAASPSAGAGHGVREDVARAGGGRGATESEGLASLSGGGGGRHISTYSKSVTRLSDVLVQGHSEFEGEFQRYQRCEGPSESGGHPGAATMDGKDPGDSDESYRAASGRPPFLNHGITSKYPTT